MKRIFSVALVFCLILAGCGGAEKNMLSFSSDSGYTVSYPEEYTPTKLGSEIDFVIMDDETGTNVTIQHKTKLGTPSAMDSKKFISKMKDEGYSTVELTTFEKETINGTPCLVAEFFCKENTITKIFYDASDTTYVATLTLLPGTRKSVIEDLTNVIRGINV